MGGLAVSSAPNRLYTSEYIPGSPVLTLTPAGLYMLCLDGGWPIPLIEEDDIKDLSKADTFTKLWTCLQALYMIVQCLLRLI